MQCASLVHACNSTRTTLLPQAFTPIVTMASLFVARLETPTRPLVLSVSLIALGTMLSSAGEVRPVTRQLVLHTAQGVVC